MAPLAERMRPKTLDGYVGQQHLVGPNKVLRRMIESGRIASFILWGPPGVGKTTLAKIIARTLDLPFYTLSAVSSGVKDVRDVIERAKKDRFFHPNNSPILFIDEIHRFSKSQQDSLLEAVETGVVTLIGATTENPSFEVIRPLLSRCQVYTLKPIGDEDLLQLLQRVLTEDEIISKRQVEVKETAALLRYAGGDCRKFLNIVDLVCGEYADDDFEYEEDDNDNENENQNENHNLNENEKVLVITDELVVAKLQENPMAYDKDGEMHYDLVSAMIKSIRGSDPDAAIYYMARMIEGGEDPAFIARRLVISASEDIGLANPNALLLANAAFDAVQKIGWPEGRIPLAEACVYLASSPKSNASYNAINSALQKVRETGNLPVPLHLRNAPTALMAKEGYGQGYKYAHDYPGHFAYQQYLPDALVQEGGMQQSCFYRPQPNPQEDKLKAYLNSLWGDRFK
ncbi:MAG: replication-associated recombination protein A [Bacteroidales bacterium]|nr:replication-associated recombination protein A [Bacteroidales bacterium]